jgi:hypothetical protein
VRAVSKNRPKYPMLNIPFKSIKMDHEKTCRFRLK